MTAQMVLTVEIDNEATRAGGVRSGQTVNPGLLLSEVNSTLRQWSATNPFDLCDPEHLRLSMALQSNGKPTSTYKPALLNTLADDLTNQANDLLALAKLARNAATL